MAPVYLFRPRCLSALVVNILELVGGLAIGFGLGYGLDVFFETLPIFMIIFTLLGFVAGVRTMLATAREVQKDHISGLSEKDR